MKKRWESAKDSIKMAEDLRKRKAEYEQSRRDRSSRSEPQVRQGPPKTGPELSPILRGPDLNDPTLNQYQVPGGVFRVPRFQNDDREIEFEPRAGVSPAKGVRMPAGVDAKSAVKTRVAPGLKDRITKRK